MRQNLSLRQHFSRGMRMLAREKEWGTTFAMLSMVMLLLQLLLFSFFAAQGGHQYLRERAALHVEVLPGAPDQDIQELFAALKERPDVDQVSYVPRDKAYERERIRNPQLVESLEKFRLANPFPDAFFVTLDSLDAYDAFVEFVSGDQWKRVVDPAFLSQVSGQQRELQQYFGFTRGLQTVATALLVIGVLALLGIAVDLIRHRAVRRKEQLMLESLLGASPIDALLPLVTEVTLLLFMALVCGTLLATLLLSSLPIFISSAAPTAVLSLIVTTVVPALLLAAPIALLVELLFLPVLALGGSLLGVNLREIWLPLPRLLKRR